MARGILPALKRRDEQRPILTLFLIASMAIAGFYGAALGVRAAHQPGDGRVLAVVGRAPLGRRVLRGVRHRRDRVPVRAAEARPAAHRRRSRRAVRRRSSSRGGIIGTLHHLYFSGTPTFVLALGSVFSALEVVPLLFVGFEAWENLQLSQADAVGAALPLADLLLRRGRVLEPRRRRPVRLHDQPADRAVLHAGPEHDAGARPRGAVRRLRHARHGADAVLAACAAARPPVARRHRSTSRSGRSTSASWRWCC